MASLTFGRADQRLVGRGHGKQSSTYAAALFSRSPRGNQFGADRIGLPLSARHSFHGINIDRNAIYARGKYAGIAHYKCPGRTCTIASGKSARWHHRGGKAVGVADPVASDQRRSGGGALHSSA